MEEVGEVKKKSKGKESRFGRRYEFEIKLRCVKLHLEEGVPLSLLSKEVGPVQTVTSLGESVSGTGRSGVTESS